MVDCINNATSGTPERINSRAGIYISARRSRLKPSTVEKMVFLHGYLTDKEPLSKRFLVARERFERFITHQSIDCQLKDDGVEFLNSLCAWIYIDDSDDEDEEEEEEEEEEDAPEESDSDSQDDSLPRKRVRRSSFTFGSVSDNLYHARAYLSENRRSGGHRMLRRRLRRRPARAVYFKARIEEIRGHKS